MKLALIGDIHGELRALQDLLKRVPPDAPVIQVGDFGSWPHKPRAWVDPGRLDTILHRGVTCQRSIARIYVCPVRNPRSFVDTFTGRSWMGTIAFLIST